MATDETFTVPASGAAPYVELDQGLWKVTITNVPGTAVTASSINALFQRWQ